MNLEKLGSAASHQLVHFEGHELSKGRSSLPLVKSPAGANSDILILCSPFDYLKFVSQQNKSQGCQEDTSFGFIFI
ncbi:hypothetical protein Leryth_008356 [Lithospermum erythrorhizon]|nr:hypothetical protein Leryth_008356 [Lithospermum erythrorhizon]